MTLRYEPERVREVCGCHKKQHVYNIYSTICVLYVFGGTQMSGKKRVQVVFTEEQWNLISKFRGEFGDGDADIVRYIVLSWLAEKSMISTNVKQRILNGSKGEENL